MNRERIVLEIIMPNSVEMEKIIKSSLYTEIPLDENIVHSLDFYFSQRNYNDLSVDMYCPQCGQRSTFKPILGSQLFPGSFSLSYAFFEKKIPFGMLNYCCARDAAHVFSAQIILGEKKCCIKKIGQNPSVADIDAPEFNKFSNVLPKEQLSDLKKSAGLVSHGIGAGSFVYLRRVIEYLLNSAHDQAEKANEINPEEYARARIVERIKMLKKYLPDMMVENAAVYGILSKGVHELDEKTCIEAYPLMKGTIVEILEDLLVKRETEKRRKDLSNEISQLSGKLKGNS